MDQLHLLPGHAVSDPQKARQTRELQLASPRESDAVYFARRANEERTFALRQQSELARSLHLEIAERYASFSAAIQEVDEKLG
jgi:hypothetical protein